MMEMKVDAIESSANVSAADDSGNLTASTSTGTGTGPGDGMNSGVRQLHMHLNGDRWLQASSTSPESMVDEAAAAGEAEATRLANLARIYMTAADFQEVAVPDLVLTPPEIEGCDEGHDGLLCTTCAQGYTRTGNFRCR